MISGPSSQQNRETYGYHFQQMELIHIVTFVRGIVVGLSSSHRKPSTMVVHEKKVYDVDNVDIVGNRMF